MVSGELDCLANSTAWRAAPRLSSVRLSTLASGAAEGGSNTHTGHPATYVITLGSSAKPSAQASSSKVSPSPKISTSAKDTTLVSASSYRDRVLSTSESVTVETIGEVDRGAYSTVSTQKNTIAVSGWEHLTYDCQARSSAWSSAHRSCVYSLPAVS